MLFRSWSDETVWTRRIVETSDEFDLEAGAYWHRVNRPVPQILFFLFAVAILAAAFFALRVDINEFSLNAMYANRVARCYLGASRRKAKDDLSGAPCHSSG